MLPGGPCRRAARGQYRDDDDGDETSYWLQRFHLTAQRLIVIRSFTREV